MFVGSADGTLSFFRLDACRGGALPPAEVRAVRCGVSGVEVEWVAEGPAAPPHVFATSDQAVMVRYNPAAPLYSDGDPPPLPPPP